MNVLGLLLKHQCTFSISCNPSTDKSAAEAPVFVANHCIFQFWINYKFVSFFKYMFVPSSKSTMWSVSLVSEIVLHQINNAFSGFAKLQLQGNYIEIGVLNDLVAYWCHTFLKCFCQIIDFFFPFYKKIMLKKKFCLPGCN